MDKHFAVPKAQSAEDGSPYVYISLVAPDSPTDRCKPQTQPPSPSGNASSIEDMVKGLPKEFPSMFGGGGAGAGAVNPNAFGAGANSTTLKLGMREYEESGIRIGDRIKVGMTKKEENTGV